MLALSGRNENYYQLVFICTNQFTSGKNLCTLVYLTKLVKNR